MLVPVARTMSAIAPGRASYRLLLPDDLNSPPEDTRNVSSAVFLSTVLAELTLPLWMLSVL